MPHLVGDVVVKVGCVGSVHSVGDVWTVASGAGNVDGVPRHPKDLARACALHQSADQRSLLIIQVYVMGNLLLFKRRKKG